MSGFLYYIPGVPENYLVCGGKLAYAFEGKPAGRKCFKGPDGNDGVVFGTEKIGYFEAQQTWQDVPFLDCWVGFYSDDPPKESDLRRKKMLLGKSLEISGEQWQIPIARSFQEIDGNVSSVCNLSTYLSVDYETGEWSPGKIHEEYQPLWDAALRYWDIWWHANIGDDESEELTEVPQDPHVEIAPRELEELTLLAISTNYRIGRVEASLLRLLTTEDCFAVMNTITDLDSFNELVKKNLSQQVENSGTGNGRTASPEPTPQLSLTG